MDQEDVLDLRQKKNSADSTEIPVYTSDSDHPLDLSISKIKNSLGGTPVNDFESYLEYFRPSVIRRNLHFTPNISSQRSRWNHRSHPSIDSDSSFESEQENEYTQSGTLEKIIRRESSSTTDTENDSETCESSSTISLGFYKELPTLTANVSLDQKKRKSMILELSSFQAEIMEPEDVQSELENHAQKEPYADDNEENEEINGNCLKIIETENYIEELIQMQAEVKKSPKSRKDISSVIQERATKYIKEIHKTRSDICSSGLNLEVDGTKKQQCLKCNEEFFSAAALLKHLMTHSSLNPGERLIKCPVCTKRFSTLNTLEKHIQKLHTGEMKYVCHSCELPFKYSTHLRKHMITSRCGKGTKNSSQVSV
ncbi:B-cell CLL/lymphoma 6 member B protein [Frankliniella fusca]|uniref:B-cell CLL/lymphoma 6 member B protein n=1 Tax=Frankliniella fusca TaxID=407009 RepID=A0AAE1LNK3_9NEOP|nr:B-cell CLL/lymphoma 6 member B protein [Frankliniella fusca]